MPLEDADAHLLNLNVVAGTQPNSPTVILRVNHSRGEFVGALAARYGYDIRWKWPGRRGYSTPI